MRINVILSATIAASLLFQSPALPQQTQAQPRASKKNAASNDAVVVYSSGLEAVLIDPKDKGLVTALRLLDDRVAELPRELNKPQMFAPIAQLALDLLFASKNVRIGLTENPDPREGPPFTIQVTVDAADRQQAESLAGRFAGAIAGVAPVPSRPAPNMPGISMIDLDGVPLYHGTMNVGGKPSFVLALNKADPTPLTIGQTDLPQGTKPVFGFTFDARKLQPLLEMAINQPEREAEMRGARLQLEMMGLYGPDALAATGALGYGPDRCHAAVRCQRYRQLMEESMALSSERLTADEFRRVPADATYAQLTKYNLTAAGTAMQQAFEQMAGQMPGEMPDPLAMFEQQTGIHPQRDLFAHLDQTIGFYMSDTTGGGGLFSAVMFVEVKNPEALNATIARLMGRVNQLAQQHAKGYVRLAERSINNQKLTVITFPGLPVPLELCWAMSDGYLYAAGSPQALTAAINQGRSGKQSLVDNPRFKEMGGENLNDAIQVTFVDTPRLLRDGYGLVNLGLAALANAVRSPTDAARDPGLIMPSYADLANNAKAALTISRIQGDDLVATCQFDRSILVNACGTVGLFGSAGGAYATAIAAAIMIPALEKARGHAREHGDHAQSAAQLRQISMAIMIYAQDHNDRLPQNLRELVDGDYVTHDLLQSPLGPVADHQGDYWFNTSVGRFSGAAEPDRQILGYDRASYAGGDQIAVVFFDGHVETMSRDDFDRIIAAKRHAGVEFNQPE